ncbi:sugar phosphate permease [Nonomuraea thailandensis]|uniref:Sugar phosphate permease n=1 Tax=Nonomuraea thailandensis TaxID=1188745 RepID=A0A9X2GGI3_9ACTN|nr:MFS transporter [Nonomuraea thailandensis]MCP2354961.1 sugar phosphate permease [Nonomuraea thailandensis]
MTAAETVPRGGGVRPDRRAYGPRHRWVVLAVGVGAQAAFAAMFSGIPVTGVSMRAGYHLSTEALGLVLACLGLGVAASDIVWGLLTDRFGDRRVLLTGLSATGALLAVMAVAVTPPDGAGVALLALCLALAGALGGSVNGASGRAVMTWFAEGERGFAMSIRQTAIPVGGAVGVALLPWLAGSYGFRAAYAVPAAFCLAAAAATWRWLHEPAPPDPGTGPAAPASGARPRGGAAPRPEVADDRSPLRRWDVWRLALAGALLTVPQFAVLSFTAIFLHDVKGEGATLAGITVVIAQLGGGAARIWTGRRTDRTGARRTHIRAIGVLAALAMAGAAALTDAPTPLTVTALALGGLLANAWHGVAYTEIAAMAGASRAGAALGLLGTTLFAMGFLTPLLIPMVIAHTSWAAVWGLAAAASLLAVPLAPGEARARR